MKHSLFLALAICSAGAQAQGTLSVDWTWKRSHQCTKVSPELKVGGLPAGTRTLQVKMVDNDAPAYPHGGGEVAAGGKSATVPEGALKSYTGPCPPNFGNFGHDYAITVTAVGADGKVLGTGTATKNFSAKSVPQ